jgi:hypothetical protein
LAPLLGQLGLLQSARMCPLLKISPVVVHAECWYRPVSSAGLPTAREVPQFSRVDSGFNIVSLASGSSSLSCVEHRQAHHSPFLIQAALGGLSLCRDHEKSTWRKCRRRWTRRARSADSRLRQVWSKQVDFEQIECPKCGEKFPPPPHPKCGSLLSFVWSSILVSACEGCMSRKLVWVEGQGVNGWEGCSECAWVFIPSGPPLGESLNERARNLDVQLSEEFAAHDCAEHPRVKTAKAS